MLDLPFAEADFSPLAEPRTRRAPTLQRRLVVKQLLLSTISMSGVIGVCHALHRDPQLEAALSSLCRRLPASPPKAGVAGDAEPSGAEGTGISSGFDPSNYREFLATIPLRHISIHQVVHSHFKKRGGIANTLPPPELWGSMTPTLLLADELAHRLEAPLLEVTSAYRSPEYNAQIQGAAEGSFHVRNQALDLKFDCPVSRVAATAHRMREEGLFLGGIGIYPTFLHLDTRGHNADWDHTKPAKA